MKRLETARLLIRDLEEADLDRFDSLFNTDFVTRYLCMEKLSREDCLAYIRQMIRSGTDVAVALKSDNGLIGKIHMDNDTLRYGVQSVSLAYWLGEPYTGKGYMTEALQAVIEDLFLEKGFDVISAAVLTPNTDSVKLLQRLGFTQEGSIRKALLWQDVLYDNLLFSLTREDHAKQSAV